MSKRQILVGIVKPEKIEGNNIYVHFDATKNPLDNFVGIEANSNQTFKIESFEEGFTEIKEVTKFKHYTLKGKESSTLKYINSMIKLNNAESNYDSLIEQTANLFLLYKQTKDLTDKFNF